MSEGNDGYYFDQQASDDAAAQANALAFEAEYLAAQNPAADPTPVYDSPGFVDPSYSGAPLAPAPAPNPAAFMNAPPTPPVAIAAASSNAPCVISAGI